ncbi:MAG: hypothetical protein RL308_195 [Bacteroidota bacterium]|jgi:uncharacterized iron-regulated protein
MKTVFLIFSIGFFGIVASQNKQSYQIFNQSGKKVSYKKLINTSQKSDVLLFGEFHDNSVAHWLELEITKDLFDKKGLVLGAEMLEADNQKQVNQYLKGEINQKKLDSTARLWPNYKTDYRPLVDFAKEKNLGFVATNIPRRFASLVFKKGFEALEKLSDEEKSWIAPLPILYDPTLPGYLKIVQEMGGHGGENLPKAQAVKDATMAYFISKNRTENSLFIHYNGSYHSDNFEGIYWYLNQQNSNLKISTIATVTQKDISKLEVENYNKATFIIVIDEDVTKTY